MIDSEDEARIVYMARTFSLFLVGCTLFTDKSATQVPIAYLSFLEDLGVVGEIAWAVACLAYTYRQLDLANRSKYHSIVGYVTLIQAWIYEHFLLLDPVPNLSFRPGMSQARRY